MGGGAEHRCESDLRFTALSRNRGLQLAGAGSLPTRPPTDDTGNSVDPTDPSPADDDSIAVGAELVVLFLGESRGCS
uniref:Uncharacterized protein n=1 Tax=Oryza punctata TaxID=4537 RepID=A0A0E0M8H8_ORYPU